MAQIRVLKNASGTVTQTSPSTDEVSFLTFTTGTYNEWTGAAAPAVSPAGSGRIYFDSTSNTFKVSQNAGAYTDLVGGSSVTLSQAYANGVAGPQVITLDATRLGVFIRDSVGGIGAALFAVQNGSSQDIVNITASASTVTVNDASTAAVSTALTLVHFTTAAGADGIGTGLLFRAKDDGGTMEDIASISAFFIDNAAASEDSAISMFLRNGGAAREERFRFTMSSPIGTDAVPTLSFLSPSTSGLTHIQTGGAALGIDGRFVFTTSMAAASTQNWFQFTNESTNTSLVGNFLEVLNGSTAIRFSVKKPYGIEIGDGGSASPVPVIYHLDTATHVAATAGNTSVWGLEMDFRTAIFSHPAGTGQADKRQHLLGLGLISGGGAGTSWANYIGLDITTIQAAVATNVNNVGITSTLRVGSTSVNIGTSNTAWAYRDINVPDKTLTVGGGTASTVAVTLASVFLGQVTLTDATAVTQPSATTLYIKGAPIAAGSVTLTSIYALWSDAGLNRFDGDGTHVFELPADATGNATAATGRVPIKVGGATKYLRYFDD